MKTFGQWLETTDPELLEAIVPVVTPQARTAYKSGRTEGPGLLGGIKALGQKLIGRGQPQRRESPSQRDARERREREARRAGRQQ
jgi:hypothetical protein